MAATDKPYRNQRWLDIVFGASCVLLLLSTFWMLYQDHSRGWKSVQREFRDVETVVYKRSMVDRLPDKERIEAIETSLGKIQKAQEEVARERAKMAGELKPLQVAKAQEDSVYQDLKARFDSVVSHYNIAVDERDQASGPTKERLAQEVERLRGERDQLEKELNASAQRVEEKRLTLDQAEEPVKRKDRELAVALAPELRDQGFRLPRNEEIENLGQLEDVLKKQTTEMDRLAKNAAQKSWKFGDWFRALPVLDGFASPYRIQQITLDQLTIDYGGFKDVPRADRCTTCHQGIDRPSFSADTLRGLATVPDGSQDKLTSAIKFLKAREAKGENLGFNVGEVPSRTEALKLSESQVKQYCAHPRLDLYVDANSPHPAAKFGCTICHQGQGSATEFTLAAHAPDTAAQAERWAKDHQWASSHFWDFPMLPSRFIESSCLKCHHQVMDLVNFGSREEAPKLLRGYQLVRENGCFGCHEIAGRKGGREVGPDMRLEPWPPLDALSAEERAKMLADENNPPGTYRKVGPSLRRLSEKTTQFWTRQWLRAPRDFRYDTKMPHFYQLSNNLPDVLPETQKEFPQAEMSAITHYLFEESQRYLEGKDSFRRINEGRKRELEAQKKNGGLNERQQKELAEVTRRLELAPVPEPLTRLVVDGSGKPVTVPAAPTEAKALEGQLAEGRRLFLEKGCLACHSHEDTEAAAPGTPGVVSEANFGPNLTRLAAKIGVEETRESGRRWLVQWLLNPFVHSARTRMPITHLNPAEAAAMADWLLSRTNEASKKWRAEQQEPGTKVTDPRFDTWVELTRVFLKKGPGIDPLEVDAVLTKTGDNTLAGFTAERVQVPLMSDDADEHVLRGPVTVDKMKYYIGKKAITRLGCFGCHDIPGFETAKPIGTPLNDWGRKDPERLAFEDVAAYVKDTYHVVEARDNPKEPGQAAEDWKVEDGKMPYEKFYADQLMGHRREGFLNQKLLEPRSYDYHRDLKWDDRLRMPQFKFARTRRKAEESDAAFEARRAREEAEAREAVMTFVLGLVAEPVNPKYVHNPEPDKLAEIRGRIILERFNCAGCHQVRPGVYEFKLGEDTKKLLAFQGDSRDLKTSLAADHPFLESNAWSAPPPPANATRLTAFGTLPQTRKLTGPEQNATEVEDEDAKVLDVRLAQALAFPAEEGTRTLPAGRNLAVFEKDIGLRTDPYGGYFTDLMVPYLSKKDPAKFKPETLPDGRLESAEARAYLPPPLVRQGEKVQTEWLYQFLPNPYAIRPLAVLRMPRFNLSEEDTKALVNYFAGVDRAGNPGIGLSYPYLTVPERSEGYWRQRSRDYVRELAATNKLQARAQEYLAEADRRLAQARDHAKRAVGEAARKAAQEEVAALEQEVRELKDALQNKDAEALKRRLDASDLYWTDAYRLVAARGKVKSACLQCHNVGEVRADEQVGPALEAAFQRLRPDWTERWIGNPNRMIGYPSKMPQNYPADQTVFQELLPLPSREQVRAARDVVFNLERVADMPVNRFFRAAQASEAAAPGKPGEGPKPAEGTKPGEGTKPTGGTGGNPTKTGGTK